MVSRPTRVNLAASANAPSMPLAFREFSMPRSFTSCIVTQRGLDNVDGNEFGGRTVSTQVPLELVLSVCKVAAMTVRQRGLPRRQWSAAAVVCGGGGEARQRLGSGGHRHRVAGKGLGRGRVGRGVGWAEGSGIGALATARVGGALEGAWAGPKAAAMGCWQRLGSEARWKGRGLGRRQRQKGRRLGRRQLSI